MAFKLKKLSITEDEADWLMELVSGGVSVGCIAQKMKISRFKVWRNMVFLEINRTRASPQKKKKTRQKYFDIDKFSNHYKY